MDEPLLGLATTRQLLVEIAVRMEMTQYTGQRSNTTRIIEMTMYDFIAVLEERQPELLNYRTVDA